MSRRKELEFFHHCVDERVLGRYARHFAAGAGRSVVGEAEPSATFAPRARGGGSLWRR